MTKEDSLKFKESIANLSVEELEKLENTLHKEISKMILDNDLITKAAIVDSLLKQKKGEN